MGERRRIVADALTVTALAAAPPGEDADRTHLPSSSRIAPTTSTGAASAMKCPG